MSFHPRDLISVGIFAALLTVSTFGIGMLGVFSPAAMLFALPLMAIANGLIFAVFLARVQGPGLIALLVAVLGVVMFASGHSVFGLVSAVLVAVICEIIMYTAGYSKPAAIIIAAGVFSQFNTGALLPVLWNSQAYFDSIREQMGAEYADGMRELFTLPILLLLAGAMLVCSALGGWLGVRMTRKHFRRAGVVA